MELSKIEGKRYDNEHVRINNGEGIQLLITFPAGSSDKGIITIDDYLDWTCEKDMWKSKIRRTLVEKPYKTGKYLVWDRLWKGWRIGTWYPDRGDWADEPYADVYTHWTELPPERE